MAVRSPRAAASTSCASPARSTGNTATADVGAGLTGLGKDDTSLQVADCRPDPPEKSFPRAGPARSGETRPVVVANEYDFLFHLARKALWGVRGRGAQACRPRSRALSTAARRRHGGRLR